MRVILRRIYLLLNSRRSMEGELRRDGVSTGRWAAYSAVVFQILVLCVWPWKYLLLLNYYILLKCFFCYLRSVLTHCLLLLIYYVLAHHFMFSEIFDLGFSVLLLNLGILVCRILYLNWILFLIVFHLFLLRIFLYFIF